MIQQQSLKNKTLQNVFKKYICTRFSLIFICFLYPVTNASSEWEKWHPKFDTIDTSLTDVAGIVSVQNAFLNFGHICGGAILTRHYVISSASCYVNLPSDIILNFLFIVIDINIFVSKSSIKQIRHVNRLMLHPLFDNKYQNDVALIFVNKKIILDDVFTRILPIIKQNLAIDDDDCITAGWLSELDTKTHSRNYSNLLTAEVIIVNNNLCASAAFHHSEDEYCVASFEDKSYCFIHGGSPLICSGGLAAIRPFSQRMCINKTSGVIFVPVTPHLQWIQQIVTSKKRTRRKRRLNRSTDQAKQWKTSLIVLSLVFDKFLLNILDSEH